MALMVSSCNDGGGLYLLRDGIETLFSNINCRGICLNDDHVFAAVHETIYRISPGANPVPILKLPRTPHDIRVVDGRLLVMDTAAFQLFWVNLDNFKIEEFRELTPGKHHNCVIPWGKYIIRSESVKRPDRIGFIICETPDGERVWQAQFHDGSEIHSLVVRGNRLYWCASNWHCVRSAQISQYHLTDIKDELYNMNGYVRGLIADNNGFIVGTSGNRRPEKYVMKCLTPTGVVHIQGKKFLLPSLEVYEILDVGDMFDKVIPMV